MQCFGWTELGNCLAVKICDVSITMDRYKLKTNTVYFVRVRFEKKCTRKEGPKLMMRDKLIYPYLKYGHGSNLHWQGVPWSNKYDPYENW